MARAVAPRSRVRQARLATQGDYWYLTSGRFSAVSGRFESQTGFLAKHVPSLPPGTVISGCVDAVVDRNEVDGFRRVVISAL